MMHDQRAEILGVSEHVAHDLGVGEAGFAVGEGDGACIPQESDLAHLLAEQTLGHGRHGMNVHQCGVAGAPQNKVDQSHVVDHGIGVRHADDGGDSAGGGGTARRGQRLAMLVPGLAGKHHHVDQTGGEQVAAAIDNLGIACDASGDMRPEIDDEAVPDQQASLTIQPRGRVEQARIDQGDGARALLWRIGLHRRHSFGRWRASACSTAMRTATPISTCSRMTLRASSATLELISTPRFIGPGCMMSASGLARASLS